MTHKFGFLPQAQEDLTRIYQFLSPINKVAAKRALQAIYTDVENLASNPLMGRPLENPRGFRKWVVQFGSGGYVIHYRVTEREIIVVRIWHAKEIRR